MYSQNVKKAYNIYIERKKKKKKNNGLTIEWNQCYHAAEGTVSAMI